MDPSLEFIEFDPDIDNCDYVVETDVLTNLFNAASELAREIYLDPDLEDIYDWKELLGIPIDPDAPPFMATGVDLSSNHLITVYLNHNQLSINEAKRD